MSLPAASATQPPPETAQVRILASLVLLPWDRARVSPRNSTPHRTTPGPGRSLLPSPRPRPCPTRSPATIRHPRAATTEAAVATPLARSACRHLQRWPRSHSLWVVVERGCAPGGRAGLELRGPWPARMLHTLLRGKISHVGPAPLS